MLTSEELLRRRVKIADDYPNSPYKVGDIFSLTKDDMGRNQWVNQKGEYTYRMDIFDKYPKVFAPLAWWEERKPEDMPEYVKCVKTPDQRIMPGWVMEVKWMDAGWGICGDHTVLPYTDCFVPATHEEYLTYKNKNNE